MIQFFNQSGLDKTKMRDFRFCPYCGMKFKFGSDKSCEICGFKQYKNPLPGVSILISNSENQLLLGKRKNQSESWCLPCGFIETNENFLIAAHREVKEETGLEIHIDSIVNVVSNIINFELETFVVVLLANIAGGELIPGDDIVELKWIDSNHIPSLAFKADEFIINQYFNRKLEKLSVESIYA